MFSLFFFFCFNIYWGELLGWVGFWLGFFWFETGSYYVKLCPGIHSVDRRLSSTSQRSISASQIKGVCQYLQLLQIFLNYHTFHNILSKYSVNDFCRILALVLWYNKYISSAVTPAAERGVIS